jgi:hypothetical protein
MGKIIHQYIAIQYKALDRNTLPYYRYTPEPVLESANIISYRDRFTITDTIDFNRSDITLDDLYLIFCSSIQRI